MLVPVQTSIDCQIDLDSAERIADKRLEACRKLALSTSGVVDALSCAGSSLQRAVSEALNDGVACMAADQDLETQDAVRSAFEACSSISSVLVSLAASLSGGLQIPIQNLEKAISAERLRRKNELDELRRRQQACTSAVTESLQKKERLSADLRAIANASPKHTSRALGWISMRAKPDKSEHRLHQANTLYTSAVERFGECMEEAVALSNTSQSGTAALVETLGHIDSALSRNIHQFLVQCVGVWESAVGELNEAALNVRACAEKLPPLPDAVGANLPVWACQAFPTRARSTSSSDNNSIGKRETHSNVIDEASVQLAMRRFAEQDIDDEEEVPPEEVVEGLTFCTSSTSHGADNMSSLTLKQMATRHGEQSPELGKAITSAQEAAQIECGEQEEQCNSAHDKEEDRSPVSGAQRGGG